MHPVNSMNHKWKVIIRRVLPFPASARARNIIPVLQVGKSATTTSYLCTNYPEGVIRYQNSNERESDIVLVKSYKSTSTDEPLRTDVVLSNFRGRRLERSQTRLTVPLSVSWYIALPLDYEDSSHTENSWFSIPYIHSCTLSRLISKVPRSRSAPAMPMPLWLHIFLACLDAIHYYRSVYQEHSLLYSFTTDNVSLIPRTRAPPLIALMGLETIQTCDNNNIEARKANIERFYDFLRTIRGVDTQDRDIAGEFQHHLFGASFASDPIMYTPDELEQLYDLYTLSWSSPFGIPDGEYKEDDGQSELKWLKKSEMFKAATKVSSHMYSAQSHLLRTFLEKEVRAEERMFREEVNRKNLF